MPILGEPVYYSHRLSPEFKELLIVPVSDCHYGNPLFSQEHFFRTLDTIRDTPNAYTVLNGDLAESTLKTSKGDVYKQVGTPQDQRDWLIEKLYPIKEKILGMTTGNHENRIYETAGIDISKDIAQDLSVPYRAEGLILKISFGNGNRWTKDRPYTYFLYQTHGYGGARTKSAKAVKVERMATWIHADVYLMSHDHIVSVAPDIYLMPDPRVRPEKDKDGNKTGFMVGTVTAHRKMLIKTNAYLKWGGYSEFLGFPPVDLETPIIKLAGQGKPRIRVEV